MFQRKIDQIIGEFPNAYGIVDDILILDNDKDMQK